MIEFVEEILSVSIRGVGVGILKLLTLGRYKSDERTLVAEGGLGLLVIAGVSFHTSCTGGGRRCCRFCYPPQ